MITILIIAVWVLSGISAGLALTLMDFHFRNIPVEIYTWKSYVIVVLIGIVLGPLVAMFACASAHGIMAVRSIKKCIQNEKNSPEHSS